MKTPRQPGHARQAFTLLEMSMVLLVLLSLISTGLFVSRKTDEWKLARQASEILRSAYSAQRMYLADNPTVSVSTITPALLLPYMPNAPATMPTVKSLTGTPLSLIINVSPPVINAGTGVTYDPSGSNKDSLWDVGE